MPMTPAGDQGAGSGMRVGYLACFPRSGSTVLSRLANTHSDMVAIGEILHLWQAEVYTRGDLCSCGAPLNRCPFWTAVMASAGVTGRDISKAAHETWGASSPRSSTRLLRRRAPELSAQAHRQITRIYAAISQVSGRPVIVDASKYPGYADVLETVFGQRLLPIHLIRDPRGVYASATRGKPRTDLAQTTELAAHGRGATIAKWVAVNEVLLRRWPTATHVDYSAFARDPQQVVSRLASLLNVPDRQLVADDLGFEPVQEHLIGGNPDRGQRSRVLIRPDTRWRTVLTPAEQSCVQTLCAPTYRRVLRRSA